MQFTKVHTNRMAPSEASNNALGYQIEPIQEAGGDCEPITSRYTRTADEAAQAEEIPYSELNNFQSNEAGNVRNVLLTTDITDTQEMDTSMPYTSDITIQAAGEGRIYWWWRDFQLIPTDTPNSTVLTAPIAATTEIQNTTEEFICTPNDVSIFSSLPASCQVLVLPRASYQMYNDSTS